MNLHITPVLLSVVLLGACAGTDKRADPGMAAGMNDWIGKSYTEFVAARGAPQVTIVGVDKAKTLEYARERIVHQHPAPVVVMSPTMVGNTTVPLPQIVPQPPTVLTFSCKLTVRFSAQDLLQSWRTDGNDC